MENEWDGRADREATAILAEALEGSNVDMTYAMVIALLADAYRKGAIDAMKRAQEIVKGEQS